MEIENPIVTDFIIGKSLYFRGQFKILSLKALGSFGVVSGPDPRATHLDFSWGSSIVICKILFDNKDLFLKEFWFGAPGWFSQ